MSKRHQQNRRKSYGRRQHELHERQDRGRVVDIDSIAWDDRGADGGGAFDRFSFLDGRAPRLGLGLTD
ncbi:MAG TPA: hypothetical protein VKA85_09115 [Candidatus Limnocylindrales bacterium]|nr:hypothetical protein [Candidatus Limnocylindrales bacterium]